MILGLFIGMVAGYCLSQLLTRGKISDLETELWYYRDRYLQLKAETILKEMGDGEKTE